MSPCSRCCCPGGLRWLLAPLLGPEAPLLAFVLAVVRKGLEKMGGRVGANSYLVKPVGFQALMEMVQSLHLYWLTLNEKPTLPES